MEIVRKNQKEMLEINITITDMRNATAGPISRMDIAEEIVRA